MPQNMKSLRGWFNLYFFSALAAVVVGCHSPGHHYGKKQIATIRLYMEATRHEVGSGQVFVTRQRVPMNIERDSFLDEGDVRSAQLVDLPDGTFAIEVTFNDHGAAMLDMQTVGNKGRHIVIFSHFPPPGSKEDTSDGDSTTTAPAQPAQTTESPDKPRKSGWISAVKISGRLSDGVLMFTPDTSRAEAQQIVTGLTNVASKSKIKQT